jgi:hypothetical protein
MSDQQWLSGIVICLVLLHGLAHYYISNELVQLDVETVLVPGGSQVHVKVGTKDK